MKRLILLATLLIAALSLAACSGTGAQPTEEVPTTEPTAFPTTDPNTGGGPFAGVALPDFEQYVKDALTSGDFEAAAQLMTDPHAIGFFQSEGVELSPIEAASQLTTVYKSPACTIAFPAAPADISTRLGGIDPLTMSGPTVNVVSAIYSSGWGMNCEGEAYLTIAEQADGSFRWNGTLLAPDGFFVGSEGSGAAGTPITNEGGTSTLEGIQVIVKDGLTNKDFELMALTMTTPFHLGFWRSEGIEQSPIEAASSLTLDYMAEACTIEFPFAPADISTRMDGSDPATMFGPDVALEGEPMYSVGWGPNCVGEAFLYFTQTEGVYAWYGILLAPEGFQ